MTADQLRMLEEIKKKKAETQTLDEFKKWFDEKLLSRELNILETARRFVKVNPLHYDKSGLWWAWNELDKFWLMIDETDILLKIDESLKWSGLLSYGMRNQLLTALRMAARENKPEEIPKEWLQFKNGVYDLKSGEQYQAESKYFFTNPIPHNLGESEETPVIDKLITEWVGEQQKTLINEIMAYCLLRDYPIHKFFILYGSGRNGKTSFQRLIKKVIGHNNITSTELETLCNPISSRFEKAKLFNKLTCFVGELSYSILKYTSFIKAITGGDIITLEFKGSNNFLSITNFAKLIINTNSIPMTADKTDAYYSRAVIIKFPNKFNDGLDIIESIPEIEFENLCCKLVRYLKSLLSVGFDCKSTLGELKEEYERLSNPLISFIEEFYEKNVNGYVIKSDFCNSLKAWLQEKGFRELDNKEITSALKMLGYESKQKKIEGFNYQVIYGFIKKVEGV
jgi:putative DNA primase/helicase